MGKRLGCSAGARLAVPHLHKNISRLYIHRFTNCRRLRQAHNHHVGLCGTSPICRFTVFVAAKARVPCQFHAAAAFELVPQAACAFTASRGLSGTNTFLLKTNHFLLCQWLTLMCGTVPHFLAQVKGAMAFPMQSCDRAHHTLIFRRTMPHTRKNH